MEIIGDFNTTVTKALSEITPDYEKINGLVICGTHTPKDWERIVVLLKNAREKGIPTLGICFGLQMMVVEWARHILGWEDAQSTEIQLTKHPVIAKMENLRVGIFPVNGIMESHWHNYCVNNYWTDPLINNYFDVIRTENIVEEIKLKNHPYYVGVQYHPEYQSSKDKPHPIFIDFITSCQQLQS